PSGELALWNVEDRRSPSRVRDLHGQGSVECAVFSPDGLRALTGGADKTASLWDLEGAKKLWSAVAHSDAVTTVAFLPDGKRALTGSKGMGVALWDLETGVELNRINCNAPVLSLAISPDGKRALVGCTDEHVRLLVNGFRGESCMRLLDGGHKKGTVGAVAFSPDGSTGLSCGSDGAVRLWNVDSLEQTDVVRLSQGETVALAAAFAGDGRSFFLATTGGAFLRFELK
ncbi:hypothetical protein HY251_08885, partial [bacterium]|nr:hypothetical protein [bacterium]